MATRSPRPSSGGAPAAPRQALPYDALGMDAESLKTAILGHLQYTLAELPKHVDSEWEPYVALALAVRDRMIQRWVRTQDTYYEQDAKRSTTCRSSTSWAAPSATAWSTWGCWTSARRPCTSWATAWRTCARPNGTPASATAASDAWPRASSTPWPPSAIRPTATGSATTTASSTSASSTAPRWRWPTAGCATATRGRSRGWATASACSSTAGSTPT